MVLHNNKAMPINLHDEDCEIHKKMLQQSLLRKSL